MLTKNFMAPSLDDGFSDRIKLAVKFLFEASNFVLTAFLWAKGTAKQL